MKTRLVLLLSVCSIVSASDESCQCFSDLPVKFKKFSKHYEGTVLLNGCINDRSLDNVDATKIQIGCNDFAELEANFISDVEELLELVVGPCNLTKVQTCAFNRLPSLKTVVLSDNQLAAWPGGVFENVPNLQQIFLDSNKLRVVDEDAFTNLPHLKTVKLNNNKVQNLSRNWFSNSTSLTTLLLSHNRIEELPVGMFLELSKLNWLDFSWNRISVLHPTTFEGVASTVLHLNLEGNRIKQLSRSMVPSTFTSELSLNFNLLNYLPNSFFMQLRVRRLYLQGNPFTCPCEDQINKQMSALGIWRRRSFSASAKCNTKVLPTCAAVSTNRCIEAVDSVATQRFNDYIRRLGFRDTMDWAVTCQLTS
ncbi:carboxypeptidase N subunit 2 [Dendroctonus ponderosae]|uniref:LRRCT domain-containing protein n=1 Tax=Dendroctonus ponderosae TaxID=77166 RepID=U4TVV0_DENPD|nr:carboxypeptidase N subunit 2 [Dendroctonus ponderosae]ERL85709.1 hypothetical protein D910_03124 [Dendroctonus ponderosae]KAH1004958.1 hypothetical protein HUJ05_005719 [Dendroctonus ponderosae]